MIVSCWRFALSSLILVWGAHVGFSQGSVTAHKPITPLPPAELFAFLPPSPTGWQLKESKAKNFFIGWLCAQASREFDQPLKPQSGNARGLTAITRIRVMDTGYYPSFNGDFENFRVGKYPGAESLVIAGMPARRMTLSATKERLRVSVRGRFIVEVETENQPPNTSQAWLKLFDFRRVSSIPDSGSTQLPKPLTIQSVDELTPKNNTTSQLYWGGSPSTE